MIYPPLVRENRVMGRVTAHQGKTWQEGNSSLTIPLGDICVAMPTNSIDKPI